MEFIIRPYISIGPIELGMSRKEVRETLDARVEEFKKSPTDELTTDAFDELGVYVYYKEHDVCEAVEVIPPASPIFQDEELLRRRFGELREYFKRIDDSIEVDNGGLTSYRFGIGLYVPFAKNDPDALVEGVIVFERGYYDEL